MVKVIDNLHVGSDDDFDKAKEKSYSILSCCKDGLHGHRSILKYSTLGAPKGKDYYFVQRSNHMALNLIDSDDPNFIPEPVVNAGIDFIRDQHKAGKQVLVHCNAGLSRGPTMTMMFLRSVGELPDGFRSAYRIFKTLYPKFEPTQGIEHYARSHWRLLRKEV